MNTEDFPRIAENENLISVSICYLAEIGRFSGNIQWMEGREREISSAIELTAKEVIVKSLAEKRGLDGNAEAAKAKRIADLQRELSRLTGEPA